MLVPEWLEYDSHVLFWEMRFPQIWVRYAYTAWHTSRDSIISFKSLKINSISAAWFVLLSLKLPGRNPVNNIASLVMCRAAGMICLPKWNEADRRAILN